MPASLPWCKFATHRLAESGGQRLQEVHRPLTLARQHFCSDQLANIPKRAAATSVQHASAEVLRPAFPSGRQSSATMTGVLTCSGVVQGKSRLVFCSLPECKWSPGS